MSLIETAKNAMRLSLSVSKKIKLQKALGLRFRWIQHVLYKIFLGSNLKALATVYCTDKWGVHQYAQHYEKHFAPLRGKQLNILEIGVGGCEDPELGGGSLRMWRTYFPKARIYGIDIEDKHLHNESRIKTFRGSQSDEMFLEEVCKTIGHIDIIIDDGSHRNEDVLVSFNYLFPLLSEKGFYVIEDTQTSYWPDYGGTSSNFNRLDTTMGFIKSLIDGLNYTEFKSDNYKPSYYDKNIHALYFYHNIVFIQKS